MGIIAKEMLITVEMAEKMLEKAAPKRVLREKKIMKFAFDMESGNWHSSHQGIAFDPQGFLTDGQHRLIAITIARVPVLMMVSHNVPRKSIICFDQNTTRSIADNLSISTGKHVNPRDTALARAMLVYRPGAMTSAPSADVVKDAMVKYADGINFARVLFTSHKPGIMNSVCACAIARAYYHVEKQRLAELVGILCHGVISNNDTDKMAITLRDYLMETKGRNEMKTAPIVALYKIERAIGHFMKGTKNPHMIAGSKEAYLLPGESLVEAERGRMGRLLRSYRDRGIKSGETRRKTKETAAAATAAREAEL